MSSISKARALGIIIPAALIAGIAVNLGIIVWQASNGTHRAVQVTFNHYDALTGAPLIEEKDVNATMLHVCDRNLCDPAEGRWLETPVTTASTGYIAVKGVYLDVLPFAIQFTVKGVNPYVFANNQFHHDNAYSGINTDYGDVNGDGLTEYIVTMWLTNDEIKRHKGHIDINVPWYNEALSDAQFIPEGQ